LIDILDPAESYSADFRRDALQAMAEITARKIPLLVGGTMLYYKALVEGLADMPAADPEVAQIEEEAARLGWQALRSTGSHRSGVGGDSSERSAALSRALEVYRVSGQSMTALRQQQSAQSTDAAASGRQQLPYTVANLAIAPANRQVLHERIKQRFTNMLEQDSSTRS
jgi:tRNA dimethylallyltransferase